MNADDLKLIRTKLKLNELSGPSVGLDNQIHRSAAEQAQRNKNIKSRRDFGGLNSHKVSSFLAAAASLVITMGLFVMMHQAIQPKVAYNNELAVQPSVYDIKFVNIDEDLPKEYRIARPEMELIARLAPTQQERDRILRNLDMPAPEQVMANMQLSYASNRNDIESKLALAFADIDDLIISDDLSDARSRYYALVQSCADCELPTLLEVLMLDSAAPT